MINHILSFPFLSPEQIEKTGHRSQTSGNQNSPSFTEKTGLAELRSQ